MVMALHDAHQINQDLQIGSLFLPSRVVSGDHIQILPISEFKTGVLLFDVCGKGIESGLKRNVILKFFHQAFAKSYDPTMVINFVHQAMLKEDRLQTYATVFYGVIDQAKQTLTYINAGHEPAVYRHRDQVRLLEADAMQLGADPEDVYRHVSVPFEKEDQLVVFSDGLLDAQNGQRESFGLDRVQSCLMGVFSKSSEEIVSALHQAVKDFSFEAIQKDDMSLLVITYGKKQLSSHRFIEKVPIVLTFKVTESQLTDVKAYLEPAVRVIVAETLDHIFEQLQQHGDDVHLVLCGGGVAPDDIQKLSRRSALLDVVVFSDPSQSDLCCAYMKAGARNVVSPQWGMQILEAIIKTSVTKLDQLYRSVHGAFQQNFSDWVGLTTALLQCFQDNHFAISRYELTHLCYFIFHGMGPLHADSIAPSETELPVVLTVEDEFHVRQRIQRLLSMEGYPFFEAENQEKALKILESHSVDCCILDIGLPDGSGVSLIPKIRKINPDMEIIMLTAYNTSDTIIPAFQQGILDYLVKPIDREIFLQKVSQASKRSFLNKWSKSHVGFIDIKPHYELQLRFKIAELMGLTRLKNNKPVCYKELYVLFPEISPRVSGEEIVPNADIRRDFVGFIKGLMR